MLRTFAALLFAPALGIFTIVIPLVTIVIPFLFSGTLRGLQSTIYDVLENSAVFSIFVYPAVFAAAIPVWFLFRKIPINKWKVLPLIGAGLIGFEAGLLIYLDTYFSPAGFDWEWAVFGILTGATIGLYAAWILPPEPSTRSR